MPYATLECSISGSAPSSWSVTSSFGCFQEQMAVSQDSSGLWELSTGENLLEGICLGCTWIQVCCMGCKGEKDSWPQPSLHST